jgi:hypothetical protein
MTVTLSTPAPAGGRVVSLFSSDAIGRRTGNGDCPAERDLDDVYGHHRQRRSNGEHHGDAAGLVSGSAQVAVTLRTMTLSAPSNLVGVGHPLNGTITLADSAPANATFTLTRHRPQFATVSPASLNVAAGATTGLLHDHRCGGRRVQPFRCRRPAIRPRRSMSLRPPAA